MALAPLAVPQFDALIISLVALMAVLVAIGLVALADALVRGLFGTLSGAVGWIPWVGKVVKAPVISIEHKLIGALGVAEGKLDALAGRFLHSLAKLVVWMADEIARHANLLWVLSTVLLGPEITRLIREAVHAIRTELHAVRGQIAHLADATVRPLAAKIAAVDRWAHARVHALEGTIGHVITWDIPRLRARTKTLEREYDAIWHKVKGLDALFGVVAFTGAVAIALSRLELGWLRCKSLRNIGNKLGCGGFGLLETLLSDAIEAFIVTDLCDFIYLMGLAAEQIEPLLLAFVDVEDVLIGCHGASKPVALTLPPLHLPPVTASLSLAA